MIVSSQIEDQAPPEETLDPQSWDEIRELGHRMLDDMLDYLSTVEERPVWQPVPGEVRRHFETPLPREPQGPEAAYRDFKQWVLPYPMGNIHPRFWGWVNGTGTAVGVLAELLAATVNPNAAGFDHAATYVEEQVLGWCKELLGFPREAGGLLVSGGSMANLLGLAVARNARAGFDVRRCGVARGPGLTVYASSETHSSVVKAVELLGLGGEALRRVPVGADWTVDTAALAALVEHDRLRGLRPLAVVGNAGTVNTGAVDDLEALAELCHREGLWFHVDGAFGALAAASPKLRPLVAGLEKADSLAFDLHKWMYVPYDAGCVLIRDAEAHRRAFELTPAYLDRVDGGLAAVPPYFSFRGMELSRGFRALKVWMSLKAEGADRYARIIRQNVEQARHLAALVEASPVLELLAPVPLNVVCFRFVEPGAEEGELDDRNRRILVRLQESGVAVPSSTVLDGRYALRVAITNHRTRRRDLDLLAAEVVRLGRELGREEVAGRPVACEAGEGGA